MSAHQRRSHAAVGAALFVAVVAAIGASPRTAAAQGSQRRVVTAVSVASPGITTVDSTETAAAFVRGLLADSLIEIATRRAVPGRPLRATRFLVSVTARPRDSVIRYDVRAFDSAERAIMLRDSLWTFGPAAPDSLYAVGRRMARRIAALVP